MVTAALWWEDGGVPVKRAAGKEPGRQAAGVWSGPQALAWLACGPSRSPKRPVTRVLPFS